VPSPTPGYDLDAARRRIPILRERVAMNACSHAPQHDAAGAAAERYLETWNRVGMDWDGWMEEVERARAAFADLIGADPAHVAITTSVSAATASVASALDFAGPRRRVLVSEAEFPTVAHVWHAHRRYGAEIEPLPAPDGTVAPGALDERLDERTRVVSICHGHYLDGAMNALRPLAERVHAAGALLYVDAYQTLGVRPVDVRSSGIDFLAGGCLKYLMGIPGVAFLYVRPGLVESLEPAVTGWLGRAEPFAFRNDRLDWASGARRFDTGTPPILAATVARAGMEVIAEIGVAAIASWTEHLARRLIEGGRSRGLTVHGHGDATRKTPSTAFVCERSHDVEHALRERGILASARGPVIRLAPHYYSTEDDVDRALDALAAVLRR